MKNPILSFVQLTRKAKHYRGIEKAKQLDVMYIDKSHEITRHYGVLEECDTQVSVPTLDGKRFAVGDCPIIKHDGSRVVFASYKNTCLVNPLKDTQDILTQEELDTLMQLHDIRDGVGDDYTKLLFGLIGGVGFGMPIGMLLSFIALRLI